MKVARNLARAAKIAALAIAAISAACSSSSSSAPSASCPDDLPAACPDPPPSYANDVAPIIASHCSKCHFPGKPEAEHDLSTYASVFAQRTDVLDQIHSCRMPPEGEPAPTAQERTTLQTWLICKAPNN